VRRKARNSTPKFENVGRKSKRRGDPTRVPTGV
jgi:hypothetical protein